MALNNYFSCNWTLEFSKKADKSFEKLDHHVRVRVITYFEENILRKKNPRIKGKPLTGKLAGHWAYRVGTYRVLTEIHDNKMTILAVDIGHRREVYEP